MACRFRECTDRPLTRRCPQPPAAERGRLECRRASMTKLLQIAVFISVVPVLAFGQRGGGGSRGSGGGGARSGGGGGTRRGGGGTPRGGRTPEGGGTLDPQ